ncbi:MAG: hypothetical protein ACLPQY_22995 [Streptosporangiaceae bacterium]
MERFPVQARAVCDMTTAVTALDATRPEAAFYSVNPANGEVVGTFPVCGEQEVRAAVDRARSCRVLVGRPGLP